MHKTFSSKEYVHGTSKLVKDGYRWRNVDNCAAFIKPYLVRGAHILDCGCGPGNLTADMARLCEDGNVVGVDSCPEMIESAQQTYQQLTFICADIYKLPFKDDSFDVVHAHQVFQYISEPVKALNEMKRVARSGGVIAVRDVDHTGTVFYPPDQGVQRFHEALAQLVKCIGGDPYCGRKLGGYAREAGLVKICVEGSVWCFWGKKKKEWEQYGPERLTGGKLVEQMELYGIASERECQEMGSAVRRWNDLEDATLFLMNCELIGHKATEDD